MIYLSIVPLASVILGTLLVQPQSVALGIPAAGIGLVVMALQLTGVAGSLWSSRLRDRFGEAAVIYATPAVVVVSLLLLTAAQVAPALGCSG